MTTLNRCEKMVFNHIASIEAKHKIANLSIKQIMAVVPYSERHVQRALARMEDIGVIGIDRKHSKPTLGDDAPQRWTRPLTLAEMEGELPSQQTLLMSKEIEPNSKNMAPSITTSTLTLREENRHGEKVDHYYKYMDFIEQNTDRLKRR